jgi:hypothetical protein
MSRSRALIPHPLVVAPAAFILVFTACSTLLLTACSTLRVRTDYNRTTKFTGIQTYSWARVDAGDSLWADRVRRDVNAQLAARGWKEVPSGGQVSVAACRTTALRPTLQTYYSGFGPGFSGWNGYGPWVGSGFATTEVIYTPVGSLVVDIINNQTKKLMWRGVAKEDLSSRPSRNEQKLARAVDKMFQNFPASSRG